MGIRRDIAHERKKVCVALLTVVEFWLIDSEADVICKTFSTSSISFSSQL